MRRLFVAVQQPQQVRPNPTTLSPTLAIPPSAELVEQDTTAYVYDAAGAVVQRDGPPFHGVSRFDGDGRLVYNQHTSPYTTPFVTKTYYLGSSALGGLALAELDTSGQKTKGNVYAGPRKIADAVNNNVSWHHQDPLTGSIGDSDVGGSYTPVAEFNADGVNVGFEDPAYSEPAVSPKLRTEWPMLAQRGGCTGTPCAQGCYVNGFELECGMVTALQASGAVEQCPDNNCGPRRGHDKYGNPVLVPLTTNPNTGQLGYFPNGYGAGEWGITIDGLGHPTASAWTEGYTGYVWKTICVDGECSFGPEPTAYSGSEYFQAADFDTDGIAKLVNATLSSASCADCYQRILGSASAKNPPLDGGNMEAIFRRFLAQKKGGFTRTKPRGNAGFGGVFGYIPKGNAKIFSLEYKFPNLRNWKDAQTTLGELMHLAASHGWYSDYELAVAAHNIPEYAELFPQDPTRNVFDSRFLQMRNFKVIGIGRPKDQNNGGFSSYIHAIERVICPVPKE
jgi:hypothetical protein